MTLLVVLLGLALAGLTYLRLERLGRRAWVPMLCRAVAWISLGLLLLNLSCPARGTPLRPLVLLDASLSLGAAGGRWQEARDSARHIGEVRTFGDERLTSDSVPTRGRSLLAPALVAASVANRDITVVTDGEIDDRQDIPADILARSSVRIFPRAQHPDLAITRVSGPSQVSSSDSIPLEVTVESSGGRVRDSITVEVVAGSRRLAARVVRLTGANAGRVRLVLRPAALPKGDHLLVVRLVSSNDAEPRTDARLHLVTVAATPGVVLLAAPADWDSRFLYKTVREVSQLPVQGYVRVEGDRWRSVDDLRPVPLQQVRSAARQADLLILKGGVANFAKGSSARGVWSWPSGETGETQIQGDWYLSASDASPLSGAFIGQPVDSFPPAVQLTPTEPAPGEWVALYAQSGRRGPLRPAVIGGQEGRIRRVRVLSDGLWRWVFRGGSGEQSYRSWVAATVSWLLGAADTTRGVARPIQAVVPNGRPLLFQWVAPGIPVPQAISWSGTAGTPTLVHSPDADSLHFDGSGRATVWLPAGEYRYRLRGGGAGTVAVEQYSDEFIPKPITLPPHIGRGSRSTARTWARDWIWLFGVCVLALSGEWFSRRRLGLR
jgi:hypothetical protein